MSRADTTAMLSKLVEKRLRNQTAFWASEVNFDRGTPDERRVDYVGFKPLNVNGEPVCVECKDTHQPNYRKHWRELKVEMANMDTPYGVLVQHRRGVGVKSLKGMARQMAILSVDVLERFLAVFSEHGEEHALFAVRLRRELKPVPNNPTLVWMPLERFALLLNDGLPLGPDDGQD